ncbi:hypothetical protein KDA23_02870 [Candidatus Saccharibacteria bacterium]|nr:hypothetical protein [Candidatus Saccharibacteria bacterium]
MSRNFGVPDQIGHYVSVDMMTGRIDRCPDWPTPDADWLGQRLVASGLAGAALALGMMMGPGVPAPRIDSSASVIKAPDMMKANER